MTPSEIALIVVSAIVGASWVPVGVYFWRSWKRRGSPLSLAICALIAFPIFTNLSSAIFLAGSTTQTIIALVVANLLLLMNFVVCFRWQKERFPNARSAPPPPATPPDYWRLPARKSDAQVQTPQPPPASKT